MPLTTKIMYIFLFFSNDSSVNTEALPVNRLRRVLAVAVDNQPPLSAEPS